MSRDLLDKTVQALSSSAQFRQLRESITAANIANAETPGYVAKKVDFEDALARALEDSDVSKARPDVYDNPDASINPDGNTVDLEREMSSLAENSLLYKAAIQLINKKLAALKYVSSDGGR